MLEYFSKNTTLNLATVDAESIIPFSTQKIQKGNCVVMSGNSAEVNQCGVYNVNVGLCFNASVAGDLTFEMYVNGVQQPQAERIVSVTADDYFTVDLSTYVTKQDNNTCCPCTAPTSVYFTVSSSVADNDVAFTTTDIQVYKATR